MAFFISLSKKYLLAIFCLTGLLAFYYFHGFDYLSFDTLKTYHNELKLWTHDHYKLSVSSYILLFSVLIACTIPCATLLTLLGGYLFGAAGALYAVFGIALGGALLFSIVRSTFGNRFNNSSIHWIKRIEDGIRRNAFNYLLFMRLVPIFPCWLSNIGAAIFSVPFKTFITATICGTFPSTVIYALAGRSLEQIINADNGPMVNILYRPSILLPLLSLALLSLLPVINYYLKK